MTHEQHRSSSQPLVARCAIITLSDTRTEATDSSGRRIRELLEADEHQVGFYQIIRDEQAELEKLLLDLLARQTIDVVLTTGGTGISRRDQTIPLIQKHLTSPLPGFGELFRMLSWQQIGSAAMLSRAIAGIANGKPIFAMPGSTQAVELAMTQLILPELRHLLYELRK